jgi:hypothetical protein
MRASIVVMGLLAGLLVLPATTAAAGMAKGSSTGACALEAQADPAREIRVTGTGFAPGATVTFTQDWGGSNATADNPGTGTTTTETVQADTTGGFTIVVPAGPGHGGQYTFRAADGACTATVQAIAIETAGGIQGGNAPGGDCSVDVSVDPGHEIALNGTGFAPGSSVTAIWTRNGGGASSLGVADTDTSGAFELAIPAGPGQGGSYAITISDGTCTTAVMATAVETAIGGTQPTPPPTDAEQPAGRGGSPTGLPIPLGAGLAVLAAAGLAWAAQRRWARRSR